MLYIPLRICLFVNLASQDLHHLLRFRLQFLQREEHRVEEGSANLKNFQYELLELSKF